MNYVNLSKRFLVMSLMLTAFPQVHSQNQGSTAPHSFASSASMQQLVDESVQETLQQFAATQVRADELAVTIVSLHQPESPAVWASHRGKKQIYPASVIKLFYLVAAHQWMEDGKLSDTDELRRAMHDMIVQSYNEATHYVVDLLTDTTSGPELSVTAMAEWYDKRNAVNRYFASLGYERVNANRKPWCEGPYGREIQSIKLHAPNHRNWLTTEETARLMVEIASGRAVNQERSREMMALLERDPVGNPKKRDQGNAYTGAALPEGAKLWSKAGWTSQVRHDAAYVELADGTKFVLVIFTENHAYEPEIIPFLAGQLWRGLSGKSEAKP